MKNDPLHDPKGLVYESFRIDGITPGECRSIFLDWALSLPGETGPSLRALIARYEQANPDHPMIEVLQEGLTAMAAPRRRGGWRSRPRN